jgi:hypothetical protein
VRQNLHLATILLVLSVVALSGCSARHEVLAVTETNLGVDVGQTPSSQAPHAKFGYQRVEVAVVPTNRSAGEEAGTVPEGAASNADVIMELRYSGIFSTGADSGLYQRLAVGKEAVQQPGATALFIRNSSGNVDKNAAAAVQALTKLESPSGPRDALTHLRTCYFSSSTDAQANMTKAAGGDLSKFVASKPTVDQINTVAAAGGCK